MLKLATPICLASPARLTLQSAPIDSRERDLRVGPVDQQQIDEGQLKPLQALIDRALEIAGGEPVEPDLGGEKDILALDPRGAHAGADLALVAVILRSVEVAIAEMQRRLDQLDAQIFLQRHGAETDDRNTRAMTFNHMTFNHLHSMLPKPLPRRQYSH